MSLEARVDKLEEHHKQMDANLHSLVKVIAEIKNISMANQYNIAGLKGYIALVFTGPGGDVREPAGQEAFLNLNCFDLKAAWRPSFS